MRYTIYSLFYKTMLYSMFFVVSSSLAFANTQGELLHTNKSISEYRIYIQPVAIVQKEHIYLKDIATIHGALPSHVIDRIETIPLWASPDAIGEKKTFSPILLRKKMQELLGSDAILCHYPQTLVVQRGGKVFTKKEIEELLRTTLIPKLQQEYSETVEIIDFRIPGYILAPTTTTTLQVISKRLVAGRNTANIILMDTKGIKEQSIPVSFTANVYINTLCAKKHIQRYEDIENVVEMCLQNTSLIPNLVPYSNVKSAYRAKRAIVKGAPITMLDIESIPVIKKGSTVQLTYNKNGVILSTQVEALSDAHIGGNVRVQPIYSKKIIQATVVNEHTVQVP